jgi:hypothetical protein
MKRRRGKQVVHMKLGGAPLGRKLSRKDNINMDRKKYISLI